MKRFFGLSAHEWVGVLFITAFVVPLGFLSLKHGVFANDTYGGTSTSTTQFPNTTTSWLADNPIVLYATSGACGTRSINLVWTRDATNTYRYQIYRDATPIFNGVSSSYVDTNLTPGVSYSYRLIARLPEEPNDYPGKEVSAEAVAPLSCSQTGTTGGTTTTQPQPQPATTTSISDGVAGGTITNTWASSTLPRPNTDVVATTSLPLPGTERVQPPLPIIPSSTYLRPGQEVQFLIPDYARTGTVSWKVAEGVAGGTITASGLYRAPSTPGTYRVIASMERSAYGVGQALIFVSTQPLVETFVQPNVHTTIGSQQAGTDVTSGTRTSTYATPVIERTGRTQPEEEKEMGTTLPARSERVLPDEDDNVPPALPLSSALRAEAVRISSVAQITDQKETAIDEARMRILAVVAEKDKAAMEALINETLDVPFPDVTKAREALIERVTEPEAIAAITDATDALESELAVHVASLKQEGGDLLYSDSNNDGISDYESERVYGLDPEAPAPTSEYRGRTIGPKEKLLLGYDPASVELIPITPEPPQKAEVEPTEAYRVEAVALTEDKKISLSGRALPNSFITIFVYSTPVVVTVQTDEDGVWSYTFEKELPDGTHTVYTATVNNSGKILAKSSGYLFTKTAEAATLDSVLTDVASQSAKPRFLAFDTIVVIVGSVALLLFVVLLVLGRRVPEVEIPPR